MMDYNPYLGRTVENSAQIAAQAEMEKKQELAWKSMENQKMSQQGEKPSTSSSESDEPNTLMGTEIFEAYQPSNTEGKA